MIALLFKEVENTLKQKQRLRDPNQSFTKNKLRKRQKQSSQKKSHKTIRNKHI